MKEMVFRIRFNGIWVLRHQGRSLVWRHLIGGSSREYHSLAHHILSQTDTLGRGSTHRYNSITCSGHIFAPSTDSYPGTRMSLQFVQRLATTSQYGSDHVIWHQNLSRKALRLGHVWCRHGRRWE